MDSYIKAGNVDRVITLVNAINGNNNQILRKYQCELLVLSLNEQQNILPQYKQRLQEFLKTECEKLEGEHKQEINEKIATTYLSDLTVHQEPHQKGI